MATRSNDPLSPNGENMNEGDNGCSEDERKELIIWGLHQVSEFREAFKANRLYTQFMEVTLTDLQNELVDLLLKFTDPRKQREVNP